LLFWGESVSVLGTRMVELALAFAVLDVDGSVAELGLVLAAHTLGFVNSVLAGGVVADRLSRRAVMIGADLLRLATHGFIAVALLAGFAEVWMLGVLSVFTGIGGGFFGRAATGLLPEVVSSDELQQANALRSTASSAGEIGVRSWPACSSRPRARAGRSPWTRVRHRRAHALTAGRKS
jgi:MFS family permease